VEPRAARLPEIDFLQPGLGRQEVEPVKIGVRDEDAYHSGDLAGMSYRTLVASTDSVKKAPAA
jgi:hypothetical protein